MSRARIAVIVTIAVAIVGWAVVPATVGAQTRSQPGPAEMRQGSAELTAGECVDEPWYIKGAGGKVNCGRNNNESQQYPGNTTWTLDNHDPGATNVTWSVYAVGFTENLRMHWNFLGQPDFYWASCSSSDARAFGVDNGNDQEGTLTDTSLLNAYQSVNYTADGVYVHFYEQDDPPGLAGQPVNISVDDEIVAQVADCLKNPDEPGWYRAAGYINGSTVMDDKTEYNVYGAVRYTYICEGCDSRKEARQKLGAPPTTCPSTDRFSLDDIEWTCRALNGTYYAHHSSGSGDGSQSASTPTPTPTLTATPTPTPTATPTPADSGGGGQEQSQSTPTATEAPQQNQGGGGQQQTQASQQQQDQGSQDRQAQVQQTSTVFRTPTIAEGPGFGALASLVGLLGAALLALRRD